MLKSVERCFLRGKKLFIELMVFTESYFNVISIKVNRMLVLNSRNQLLFVKECKYFMGVFITCSLYLLQDNASLLKHVDTLPMIFFAKI